MKKQISLCLLATVLSSTAAYSVPAIDSPFGLRLPVNDPQGQQESASVFDPKILGTTLFTGSKVDGDEGTIYYPFSKLEIVKDAEGVPKFAFSYGRKGAIVTATLKASLDQEATTATARAIATSMKESGIAANKIKIAPLPVHRGTYRSTLQMKDGSAEWIIGTTEVQNAIPTNEVAVSVALGRTAADLVVTSLQSPYTVMAWNYTYDFPGRTTPYKAEIILHWESIFEYTRTQFGFKTVVTSVDVDNVVRKLIEKKNIEIKIIGGDDATDVNKAIMDVVRIVLARTFKAHHPDPQARNLEVPKANSSGFTSMALGFAGGAGLSGVSPAGWATSVSAAYSLQTMKSEEQVDERVSLVSYPYKIFTATAGVQIPGGCDVYSKHFAYAGEVADANGNYPIMSGCPTVIYGEVPPVSLQAGQGGNAASFGGGTLGTSSSNPAADAASSMTDAMNAALSLN